MKYYGYIQDSSKNNTVTNSIHLGFHSKFSDDKQKLIDYLVRHLFESHGDEYYIEEESDLLNGNNRFLDGWCQMYLLFHKRNLRYNIKYQICVWAITEDDII